MDYIEWAEQHLLYKTKAIYDGETVIALAFCKCHSYEYVEITGSCEESLKKIYDKYYVRHPKEEAELKGKLKTFAREKE